MKTALTMVLGLLLAFGLVVGVSAEDKKEKDDDVKTLKGNITCAKCELKAEKKCATVIVVKEKDKDVVYYFDEAAGKKNHAKICKEGKKGTVTGTVKKEDDKLVVTVKEVKFDE